MNEPRWLSVDQALRLHDIQIQRKVDSRPRTNTYYEGVTNIVELAGSYAIAIGGNHPFFDGNKRTAFFAMHVQPLGFRRSAGKKVRRIINFRNPNPT